ncbi:MAG: peptidoglycan DD-metalloendopeptidase family protein [Synechococcus sp.]|uniref:M23 family metallopeptidase n=1 Tax=Synechococcus sp. BMK-MC-1 TaxID=1442551 RepID=UPI0016461BB2|nr:M23 family metallopeptidase [Synechococcus sp. BMK-MC-1]QNI67486.1 peptidoglycan-binding LysM [Synechococcus sp. BMK-MC-1]
MKPLLLAVTAVASSSALFAMSQASGFADSDHISSKQLLSALTSEPTKIWVRLIERSDLQTLARDLDLSESQLEELNEFKAEAVLEAGTWVVLPETSVESISASTALDGTEIRDTPPLKTPPTPVDVVEIKPEQSLMSLVRDHGITLTQLESFNPGVELSKLVVGSKVRVAKASVLAVRPLRSGGASWPELPALPGSQQFDASQTYIWPTKGVFTSGYGWRWGRMHKGIDIANNVGTPIVAAKDGVIAYSGWSSGYGYLVEISHGDGSSTRYAHSSRLFVKKGQLVPQGARIALMGSTGRSTGPHLHFEIRKAGGAAMDPMTMLPSRRG